MAKRNTVLATGTFDILHPGHLRFLQESKRQGGPRARLVVVVARDKTVKARKSRPPVIPEDQRRTIVAALKPVDRAILGYEEVDFLAVLKHVRPDIITVGYDQNDVKKNVQNIIEHKKLPIRLVQIGKFGPTGLNSSTSVKRKIAVSWRSASKSKR